MSGSRLLPALAFGLLALGALGLGLNHYSSQPGSDISLPWQAPRTKTQAITQQLSQDFKSISQGVTPSVVSVSTKFSGPSRSDSQPFFGQSPSPEGQGLGSGVIVDAEKGYILTNHHVIQDAKAIQVTLQSGAVVNAKLIGKDPSTDLAIIQVKTSHSLTAATLGDSSDLKVGEWVLAVGSPFGLDSSVTAGIISAKGRSEVGIADFEDFIQTDAAINPGNSGGALINIKGEVIGINTAIATKSSGYMGIGFAIPSNMARKVMDALLTHGRVIRSRLGIYINDLDKALSKSLRLPENVDGILVMGVIPDSPAAKAGFKKYDLITHLNDVAVSTSNAFRNKIAMTTPNTQVEIGLFRDGKPLKLTPTLKEMSQSEAEQKSLLDQMGFKAQTLTDELKRQFKLPASLKGVVVTEVDPRGLAGGNKGLKHGDIITEIDRQSVDSETDMLGILEKAKGKEYVLFSVIREEQSHIVALKLP